jgi:hypothetical protein
MNDDSCDFPAAHSMDTAWFAVDLDGHVALFDTGESGAAPTEGYLGEDHYALIEEIKKKLPPRTDAVHDLASYAEGEPPHLTFEHRHGVIVFVAALEDARALLDAGALEVKATKGAAVVLQGNAEGLAALHRDGKCLGCFLSSEVEEEDDEDERGLAARGVYEFEHTCENWIAGPYALRRRPAAPVSIDELPASVAEHAVRFDGRFAETTTLQPAEHWPSDSWEPAWLASDRKTVRPFEGREDEYAESRKNGEDESLVFLDSPMTPGGKPPEPPASPAATTTTNGHAPAPATKKPWWKLW